MSNSKRKRIFRLQKVKKPLYKVGIFFSGNRSWLVLKNSLSFADFKNINLLWCKSALKKNYSAKTKFICSKMTNLQNFRFFGNNFFGCILALSYVHIFEIYKKLRILLYLICHISIKKIRTLLWGFFWLFTILKSVCAWNTQNIKNRLSKYVLGVLSPAEFGWTNSKFKNRRPLFYNHGRSGQGNICILWRIDARLEWSGGGCSTTKGGQDRVI